MSKINPKMVHKLFVKMGESIAAHIPEQDYNDDRTVLKQIAVDAISQYDLQTTDEYQQVLLAREALQKELKKKYRANIITGPSAVTQDVQKHLIDKKVRRELRVALGFADSMVGVLAFKVGAIQIMGDSTRGKMVKVSDLFA